MSRIHTLLLGIFAAATLAQSEATTDLTVKGTVLELGSDGMAGLPLAGAQVSLIEFAPLNGVIARSLEASAYTDTAGSYEFHPMRTGNYYLEVKKDGYRYAAPSFYGVSLKLDQAHPSVQTTFVLARIGGSITGRVIEDGQPVPNLMVVIQDGLTGPGHQEATAVTAADGTFTASDLLPGPHVVRISSRAGEWENIEPYFSIDDLKVVDQDIETSYWPGGSSQPSAFIPVSPGVRASAGTIQIHRVSYYRAHVSLPRVNCEPGETWIFSVASSEVRFTPPKVLHCTGDFLVGNLRPGTYSFMLSRKEPAPGLWAFASVDISKKNVEVTLEFVPEMQIRGRFIAGEGAVLPSLDKIRISAPGGAHSTSEPMSPDADGHFVLQNLKFPHHQIDIQGLAPQYYIEKIRFNGALLTDTFVTLSPGGVNQVEIVVDDKAGGIAGTVRDGDNPATEALVKLVPKLPQFVKSAVTVHADKQGRFQIIGLAPGEYWILASRRPIGQRPSPAGSTSAQFAASAQSVTVERAGAVTVALQLSDFLH